MGQYHHAVNLDKREFLSPHDMGLGLKMWEQVDQRMALALVALLACSNNRGGGDLPEVDGAPGILGRWAGDRIAFVGDYTEPSDIESFPGIEQVYGLCGARPEDIDEVDDDGNRFFPEGTLPFTDITPLVTAYIEGAENGMFIGSGWKQFITEGGRVASWCEDGSREKRHGIVRDIDRSAGTFCVLWDAKPKGGIYGLRSDEPGFSVSYTRDNAPYLMPSDEPGPRMVPDMVLTA